MKKIFILILLGFKLTAFGQVDPKTFGAKADGVNDDSDALQAAIDYCIAVPQYSTPELHLSGRYRITKTIRVGGYPIKAKDAFISGHILIAQSLYDLKEFQRGTRSAQITIKGIGTTCIIADFISTELEPVIAYQAAGDGRNTTSTLQWKASIENIAIYGKGFFTESGLPQPRTLPDYKTNNQVAILGVYTTNFKLKNVYIRGFKEGVILNNCGFFHLDNVRMDYCQRAGYEIQNHSSKLSFASVWFCDKGWEIRSNNIITDVYYANHCGIGLHVTSSNNLFNSIYLESSRTTEGQLIIGDNPTDANAATRLISGLHFNGLSIVAKGTLNEIKDGIVWKENARRMSINSGEIQSCTFKYPSHLLTKVLYEGLTGNLPSQISIKKD